MWFRNRGIQFFSVMKSRLGLMTETLSDKWSKLKDPLQSFRSLNVTKRTKLYVRCTFQNPVAEHSIIPVMKFKIT